MVGGSRGRRATYVPFTGTGQIRTTLHPFLKTNHRIKTPKSQICAPSKDAQDPPPPPLLCVTWPGLPSTGRMGVLAGQGWQSKPTRTHSALLELSPPDRPPRADPPLTDVSPPSLKRSPPSPQNKELCLYEFSLFSLQKYCNDNLISKL